MTTCPTCGLVNPDAAVLCDCGLNFVTGIRGRRLVTELERDRARSYARGAIIGAGIAAVGLVLFSSIVFDFVRDGCGVVVWFYFSVPLVVVGVIVCAYQYVRARMARARIE